MASVSVTVESIAAGEQEGREHRQRDHPESKGTHCDRREILAERGRTHSDGHLDGPPACINNFDRRAAAAGLDREFLARCATRIEEPFGEDSQPIAAFFGL